MPVKLIHIMVMIDWSVFLYEREMEFLAFKNLSNRVCNLKECSKICGLRLSDYAKACQINNLGHNGNVIWDYGRNLGISSRLSRDPKMHFLHSYS